MTPPRGGTPAAPGGVAAPHAADRLLLAEQRVAAGIEETFAFFSDPANLQAITPPFLDFTILTPLPVRMGVGTLLDYRLRLLGVPFAWRTRIDDWRPGRGFTDVQIRGPYARWVHRHDFDRDGAGTRVRDRVEYRLPLSPLSDPIHALFVRPRLERIFSYRRQAIARRLGAPPPPSGRSR